MLHLTEYISSWMAFKSPHDLGALKHFSHGTTMKNVFMQVIKGLCLKTRKVDNKKKSKIFASCLIAKNLFKLIAASKFDLVTKNYTPMLVSILHFNSNVSVIKMQQLFSHFHVLDL